jgi:hypothetical protein
MGSEERRGRRGWKENAAPKGKKDFEAQRVPKALLGCGARSCVCVCLSVCVLCVCESVSVSMSFKFSNVLEILTAI